jgi:transcriptional regulator with XRE-family HTH domain
VVRPRPVPIETAFGEVLRSARQQRGLSQEALADAASLHRTYVSQIERGLKSPTLDAMSRLAGALEVQLHVLIRGAEQARVARG